MAARLHGHGWVRGAGIRCAIALAALTLSGCGIVAVVCTDELVYGVRVEARDSVTSGLLSSSPTGTLTDGEYQETMEVWPDSARGFHELVGGGSRAGGTYTVEIMASGYRPWRMEDVEVKANKPCDKPAETTQLQARMIRAARS